MKKGFTMIELLAVFTLLGIILVITLPKMTSTLKKSDSNSYEAFKKTIYIATEAYVADNVTIKKGEAKNIALSTIIDSGYLKSNLVNPKTNKKVSQMTQTSVRVAKNNEGILSYTLDENTKRYVIINMISNGSFENDFTGYYAKADKASITTAEHAFGSKSYQRGASTKAGGTCQYITLTSGHVYYYFLYTKTNGQTVSSDVSYTGWTIQANSTSWKKFSVLQKSTVAGKKNISLNFGSLTANTYVDGVGFVDLTQAFGKGNEPSKEWCDSNIDYFDGTMSVFK